MCGVRFEVRSDISEESSRLGYHTLSLGGFCCLKGTLCFCLLSMFWKLLTLADDDTAFLENDRNYFPMKTASYPQRPESPLHVQVCLLEHFISRAAGKIFVEFDMNVAPLEDTHVCMF
jgi:hypothetical protein